MAFGRVGALGSGFSRLGAGRHVVSGAAVGGAALLTGETNGFAADFTYATDASRVAVKTAGTVVSSGLSFFTNAGTSSKWVYNSTGMLVNVAAGSLAVDYDPGTLAARGLLVEPAATNLHTQSQDISAMNVTAGTAAVDNQTGPDGALTADTFTESTTTDTHGVYASNSVVASSDYTVSRFIKMGTRRYATVGWSDGTNGAYGVYDLQSGVVGSSAAIGTGTLNSASIQALPNGWYRCILSGKHPGATGYYTFGAANAATITPDAFGRQSFLGTSATLVFGHGQIEAGTVATSPIPAAGASVTRAADSISFLLSAIPALGTGYSMYTRFATPSVASAKHAFVVTDGTTSEFSGFAANTTARLAVVDGGSAVGAIAQGTITANTALSVAGRFQANNCALSTAGAAVATDVTVTLPTVTQVRYGNDGSNAVVTAQFWIGKQVIVPRAWNDAELAVRSAA